MKAPKAVISWSGGKDSAWALHEVRRTGSFEIVAAITTIGKERDRIAMHDVPAALLKRQLELAGLPSIPVRISWPCPNAEYEAAMDRAFAQARALGAHHALFGDLFLEDIRSYREAQLARTGIAGVYPLWGRSTAALAREMIAGGLQAWLVSVDLDKLPAAFAGRAFDSALLEALPPYIDPCGENGEFHTFVTAGPMLAGEIAMTVAPPRLEGRFAYADLTAA